MEGSIALFQVDGPPVEKFPTVQYTLCKPLKLI